MSVILVLGESGQVAHELSRLTPPEGWTLAFRGRREFDMAANRSFESLIAETGASAVINAAAYTAVERAEDEPDIAFLLNRDAPADLAAACARLDRPLVHFSTDYVFDGTKAAPYVEDDPKNPINVYGRSKSEGEDAILASGARSAILRTSWVYASRGENFVRTMLRLAAERDEVRVVADQIGRPTWARDCAEASLLAVRRLNDGADLGVLHVAGEGDATWADVAEAVFETLESKGGRRPKLTRISAADFPTKARRPANSRLDTSRINEVLGWPARPWRESLAACLQEIEQNR